ncbi:DUF4297 domain-containing protein [Nitrospira defluvii]|uniref:CD-NTase associated protein 4-like DNA endonuclease domain-containing protein n=1 Tax=Nitrospira defluvii TaxID=330214 RepID=A0ABM8RHS0_9BACT|nr:DUF4297 domain-containing protein [Nitrospira defluvii]CAE6753449.1 conserved hypothetical protein [Nitrospira defluvii]
MSLKHILSSRPPRETSGSSAANRFDFQKDWVVCEILELHRSKEDYSILCDYHEDVVILDKETDPQFAEFCQIKTSTGKNWNTKQLISRPSKGTGTSILGRLYSNYLMAPGNTSGLHFISNAQFDVELKNGKGSLSCTSIGCGELSEAELTKINTALGTEKGVTCEFPAPPPLFLKVTPLSVQDHSAHTKGKVAEFLEELFPGRQGAVTAVYRVLFDEVKKKTDSEGSFTDWQALKKKKSIARSTIAEMLEKSSAGANPVHLWAEACQALVAESLSPLAIRAIGREWQTYIVQRMDPTNEVLLRLRQKIVCTVKRLTHEKPHMKLKTLISKVIAQIGPSYLEAPYNADYIKAMTILEAYELISSAHQEYEEKT